MPGQATVTGKIGPGVTLTAQVIPNLASYTFDTQAKILTIVQQSGVITQIDVSAATTFTDVITAGSHAITVS